MSLSNSKRCAACKYLRRRCTADCVLSPYFPVTDSDRFSCVHKIFGASNVARMLQQLSVHQRRSAAESISMEAYYRVLDPVYGSVGIITRLQYEILMNQRELARTQAQISLCVAQQNSGRHLPTHLSAFHPQQHDPSAPDRIFLDPTHFPCFF